ncbi:MAG: 5-formyltetrahydrofolate cyclo-ligase [Telmatospirillum sp.]|nr:5-formyltetrahydrofolate cyclo-ligase [Telmatospirillum sp.]
MRAARARIHALEATSAARAVRDRFLAQIDVPQNAVVAAYAAFGGELDPLPLLEALAAKGVALALPVVEAKAAPLVFRAWEPGTPLVQHRFGMAEPPRDAPALVPDIVVAPLLAFDRQGYRLGYGGGYYDRTLAALRKRGRVLAVGIGFALQEMPNVPRAPHDVPLDWIVTERAALAPLAADARADHWMSWKGF